MGPLIIYGETEVQRSDFPTASKRQDSNSGLPPAPACAVLCEFWFQGSPVGVCDVGSWQGRKRTGDGEPTWRVVWIPAARPQETPFVEELDHQVSSDRGDCWTDVEQAPCSCKTERWRRYSGSDPGWYSQPSQPAWPLLWGHPWFSRSGLYWRGQTQGFQIVSRVNPPSSKETRGLPLSTGLEARSLCPYSHSVWRWTCPLPAPGPWALIAQFNKYLWSAQNVPGTPETPGQG